MKRTSRIGAVLGLAGAVAVGAACMADSWRPAPASAAAPKEEKSSPIGPSAAYGPEYAPREKAPEPCIDPLLGPGCGVDGSVSGVPGCSGIMGKCGPSSGTITEAGSKNGCGTASGSCIGVATGPLSGNSTGACSDAKTEKIVAPTDQKKEDMVRELLALLDETKSLDTFVNTVHVLLDIKADSRLVVPAILRNADRLRIYSRRESGREVIGAMLEDAMTSVRERAQCTPPAPPVAAYTPPYPWAVPNDSRRLPIGPVWYQMQQVAVPYYPPMPGGMSAPPPPMVAPPPVAAPTLYAPSTIREDESSRPQPTKPTKSQRLKPVAEQESAPRAPAVAPCVPPGSSY
jgi:hypothetical protein